MIDNEINIAIAKACPGIARIDERLGMALWGVSVAGYNPEFRPSWCLNAMHVAEQAGIRNDNQADSYFRWLHVLAGSRMPFESMPLLEQRGVIRASARQRAEAFLRALGEWKENK